MPRSNNPSGAGSLTDDIDTLKALVLAERDENDRLRDLIKALQRARFGRSAETLDPDQLRLGLGDEDLAAANDNPGDGEEEDGPTKKRQKRKRRGNRGCLPPHLPADRGNYRTGQHGLPLLSGRHAYDGRRQIRTARCDPGPVPGDCDPSAEIWLPAM